MTMLDDRIRLGLEAEAQARTTIERSRAVTATRSATPARAALGAAAIMVIAVLGASMIFGDGGSTSPGAATPTSPATTTDPVAEVGSTTSLALGGPFEAYPFTGEAWLLYVGEEANGTTGSFKVCHRFDPTGSASEDSSIGPTGCGDWPGTSTGVFASPPSTFAVPTGVVLFLDLTDVPVDRIVVTTTPGNDTIEVAPFVMPGSGKQFAALELPDDALGATVEALGSDGRVMESMTLDHVRAYESEPREHRSLAQSLGAVQISDEELASVTGLPVGYASYGYRIDESVVGSTRTGLVLHREPDAAGGSTSCLTTYGFVNEVLVVGGSSCSTDPAQVERLAKGPVTLDISSSCGPHPKDDPVIDGSWSLVMLWGLPEGEQATTVEITSDDGTVSSVPISDQGVAQVVLDPARTIVDITYDGISPGIAAELTALLPAPSCLALGGDG